MQLAKDLEDKGRVWVRSALAQADLTHLRSLIALQGKPGERLAVNDALISPVTTIVRSILPKVRPVRMVAFDKSDAHNWSLPWHQDRVIAVRERCDQAGYGCWSRKQGVWHCEPPIRVLERMVFVRVHLDPSTPDNGPLEIALGTHEFGRIESGQIDHRVRHAKTERCCAEAGDILIAKALILHRSAAARFGAARRALRIDYADHVLDPPLRWAG